MQGSAERAACALVAPRAVLKDRQDSLPMFPIWCTQHPSTLFCCRTCYADSSPLCATGDHTLARYPNILSTALVCPSALQNMLYGLICMAAPPGELWMRNQDADQKRRSSYVWLFQVSMDAWHDATEIKGLTFRVPYGSMPCLGSHALLLQPAARQGSVSRQQPFSSASARLCTRLHAFSPQPTNHAAALLRAGAADPGAAHWRPRPPGTPISLGYFD